MISLALLKGMKPVKVADADTSACQIQENPDANSSGAAGLIPINKDCLTLLKVNQHSRHHLLEGEHKKHPVRQEQLYFSPLSYNDWLPVKVLMEQ